jgi:hypothetical protein
VAQIPSNTWRQKDQELEVLDTAGVRLRSVILGLSCAVAGRSKSTAGELGSNESVAMLLFECVPVWSPWLL